MNPIVYENRFGELVLTPVTAYAPVSSISFDSSKAAQSNTIDQDSAEKVVLISNNLNIQVCLPIKLNFMSAFVIHHKEPSHACVCKVDIQAFKADHGMSAAQQIESARKQTPCCIF